MSNRRPYLRWIMLDRRRLNAVLVTPPTLGQVDCDTPADFYHNEMGYRSPLLARAIAHGIPLRSGKDVAVQLAVMDYRNKKPASIVFPAPQLCGSSAAFCACGFAGAIDADGGHACNAPVRMFSNCEYKQISFTRREK